MVKYKVGDKVRILHTDYTGCGLDVGSVREVNVVSEYNGVFLNDGVQNVYFFEGEVEPYTPPRQIEVGGKYTSRNGDTWECIAIKGDIAWLNHGDSTAYRWNLDGTPICLMIDHGYTIELGPKVEVLTVKGSINTQPSGGWVTFHSDTGDHKFTMEVTTLDGVPDWTTVKISPA